MSVAEWSVLVEGRLTDLPPGFAPVPVTVPERDAAVASLLRRDVLDPAGTFTGTVQPVPAVLADLELLRRPVLSVRLEVTGRGGSRQGWFAVGSGAVVGVVTLPGGVVELSLAPDVRLGAELVRAVPDAATVIGPGFADRSVAGQGAPVGRLPLGLLDEVSSPDPGSEASASERALAEELLRRTAGSLSCLVLGRAGGSIGAEQVSWLATDAGWVGLRPIEDGSPRRLVDVVAVQAADLGAWVAPTVAALVEDSDELA